MRKTKLFIAMSLDGYIADQKGGVDWLSGEGKDDQNIDAYGEFVKDIDTIIMGWNTYDQIVNELSINQWIYDDFHTYVITHKEVSTTSNITFTNKNPINIINELKKTNGKDIWICGGANIVQQLIDEDCIDDYHITMIPTLLGSGIRLFGHGKQEIKLKLIRTQSCNGMVELVYTRK